MPPTIKASKATVEANSITRGPRLKHHQTNTHNAQTHIAKGDVSITINSQYLTRGGNKERPPEGTKIHGKSATISSRKANLTPVNNTKRVRGTFKDDVTINYHIGNQMNGSKQVVNIGVGSKKTKGKR